MQNDITDFMPLRPQSKEQQYLLDNIKAEIRRKEISAVSFKMFDTLVIRPFSEQADVFTMMEKDFSMLYAGDKSFRELRCEAEEEAVKKHKKKGFVTFSEIYDILKKKSKISSSSIEKLIDKECRLEEYFCFARRCGTELFREAKSNGKKIIITVNSFLPEETIKKILVNCGFGEYDELIIPEKCNITSMTDGSLYDYIIEKMSLVPSKILHIGGDVGADVEEPVKKGVKALFLSPIMPLMVKSGRLRGYIQSKLLYKIDSAEYLVLRCAFALYAAYAFDVPQGKVPQSDFCGDEYMIGFIVLGPLSLYKDITMDSELEMKVTAAMSQNEKINAGRADFIKMFELHFGDYLEKYDCAGCRLTMEFFIKCGFISDRMSLQKHISADVMEKWSKEVIEPEIVPVYLRTAKKTNLSKFADRLFPPGSQIRIIIDKILSKAH